MLRGKQQERKRQAPSKWRGGLSSDVSYGLVTYIFMKVHDLQSPALQVCAASYSVLHGCNARRVRRSKGIELALIGFDGQFETMHTCDVCALGVCVLR